MLEFDRSVTGRLMGSARSQASLLGVSKLARDETPVIRAFRTKLQKVCVCYFCIILLAVRRRRRYGSSPPAWMMLMPRLLL